jgi:hypothetical protein
MFTNKYSRPEQPSRSRTSSSKYIEPFAEPDTAPGEATQNGRGFMAELDQWLDEMVFEPIEQAISDEDSKELHIAFVESKQHIKRKVLASYHNGLKAKSAAINHNANDKPHYRRN